MVIQDKNFEWRCEIIENILLFQAVFQKRDICDSAINFN